MEILEGDFLDKKLKAIAIDIDGTLTDDGRLLCLNAIDALRECEANGIKVMIASGNIMATSVSLSKLFGLSGPVIAENGGIVQFQGRTEILGDRGICIEALKHLKKHMVVKELYNNQCRSSEICIEEDVELDEVRRILEEFSVDVNRTGFAIHIMSEGTDKMKGVQKGCGFLRIGPQDVMAIGDSQNDVGMVRGCGIGVAVSNGTDDVKDAADHITKGSYGNGVVEALGHFKLVKSSPIDRRSEGALSRF